MNEQVAYLHRPVETNGRIIVLEDARAYADVLQAEIEKALHLPVAVAYSTGEFYKRLKQADPYAVSVDWDLGVRSQGPDVVNDLRHRRNDIAILVYTQYPVREAALREGADLFLEKAGDSGPFLHAVGEAVQLGGLLKIEVLLEELGVEGLPALPKNRRAFLDEERGNLMEHLCRVFLRPHPRQILSRLDMIAREVKLIERIDPTELARATLVEGVSILVGVVGEDLMELTSFLIPGSKGMKDEQLKTRKEFLQLVRLLSFTASVSRYRKELLRLIWLSPGMFDEGPAAPPWNDSGVYGFLIERGKSGLVEASNWVTR